MQPMCRNCAMFAPQVYNGRISAVAGGEIPSIGRCLHVTFTKVGMGRWNADHTALELRHNDLLERVTPAAAEAAIAEGFFYHDFIDVKLQVRYCHHWRPALVYATAALEHYNETIADCQLPAELQEWFDAGSPLETVNFEKLGRLQNHAYSNVPQVPAAVSASYEPCAVCEHFEYAIDPKTLNPIPFRGYCNKAYTKEDSVFNLAHDNDAERPNTYSFLTCHDHVPIKRFFKETPRHLPERLLLFVETNPPDLTLAQIAELYSYPLVTRIESLKELGLDAMLELDFMKLIQDRHGKTDFSRFYNDHHVKPIINYFGARLRTGSLEAKEFWKPFKEYQQAENDLFSLCDEAPTGPMAITEGEFHASLQFSPTADIAIKPQSATDSTSVTVDFALPD